MRLRHLQHLVGLLLVLDQREGDLGVLEDVDQLVGDRILIERHRDATDRLRGDHCRIEAWPVLTDQREVLAAAESFCEQPGGDGLDLVTQPPPADGLPDAEVLLTKGRGARPGRGMREQQPGERRTVFGQFNGGGSFRHVSVP